MMKKFLVLAACCVLLVPAVAAAKAHGGGNSSSISLVPLYTHSGGPVVGDPVTFNVSTNATNFPYVEVLCFDANNPSFLLFGQTLGFFAAYPGGPQPTFDLGPTQVWSTQNANCTATLFSNDHNRKDLASVSFTVAG
jgi:hypothetical protein